MFSIFRPIGAEVQYFQSIHHIILLLVWLDMKNYILQVLVLVTNVVHNSIHLGYDIYLSVKFFVGRSYCLFVHNDEGWVHREYSSWVFS